MIEGNIATTRDNSQGINQTIKKINMKSYAVELNGEYIDIVYFIGNQTLEEIKDSLVKHDFYNPDITVKKLKNILPK